MDTIIERIESLEDHIHGLSEQFSDARHQLNKLKNEAKHAPKEQLILCEEWWVMHYFPEDADAANMRMYDTEKEAHDARNNSTSWRRFRVIKPLNQNVVFNYLRVGFNDEIMDVIMRKLRELGMIGS